MCGRAGRRAASRARVASRNSRCYRVHARMVAAAVVPVLVVAISRVVVLLGVQPYSTEVCTWKMERALARAADWRWRWSAGEPEPPGATRRVDVREGASVASWPQLFGSAAELRAGRCCAKEEVLWPCAERTGRIVSVVRLHRRVTQPIY